MNTPNDGYCRWGALIKRPAIVVIVLLSIALSGCVGMGYPYGGANYYGGYRNYGYGYGYNNRSYNNQRYNYGSGYGYNSRPYNDKRYSYGYGNGDWQGNGYGYGDYRRHHHRDYDGDND